MNTIKKLQKESLEILNAKFELVRIRGSKALHQAWLLVNGAYWPNPHYRGIPTKHPLAPDMTHPPTKIKVTLSDIDNDYIVKVDQMIQKNSKQVEDCIIWTGEVDNNGTPYTYYLTDNKLQYKIYPKRLAYDTKHQTPELTNNQRVTTTCGFKNCVNRDHLTIATRYR